MTVPTPTLLISDMLTGFTYAGSPITSSDLHGRSNIKALDGVNDTGYRTNVIPGSSSANQTIRFWLHSDLAPASETFILSQENSPHDGATTFKIAMQTTGAIRAIFSTSGDYTTQFTLSNGGTSLVGRWVLCHVRVRAAEIDLFYDGAEESAYAAHDTSAGGGWAGSAAGANEQLEYGNRLDSPAAYFSGRISRVAFWVGTALSDAEILEDYNNEVAAMVRIDECEDHLYLCDDAAAQLSDSVGVAHLSSGNLPDFNTPEAGKAHFKVAGSDYVQNASLIVSDSRGDMSGYLQFQLPSVAAGTRRMLRPTYADASAPGPWISAIGSGANLVFDIIAHAAGGGATVSIDTGLAVGSVTDAIEWALAYAYDRATKTMIARLRTNTGLNLTGSNVGTVHAGFTPGNGHIFMATPGPVNPMECILAQAGFKNGIAYTDAQLLAALESLMPAASEDPQLLPPTIPRGISPALQPMWTP